MAGSRRRVGGLLGITALVAAPLLTAACNTGKAAAPSVTLPRNTASVSRLSSVPIRRMRRLSRREYNNVAADLLGDSSQPANRFVADVYPNGYDNGSAGLAVQSDQVVDYESAAESLAAAAVSSRMDQLLGGCQPSMGNEQACVDALISDFASRAFRRPLTATEAQRLRDVFSGESQSGSTFERGIQTVLEVILQSPQFLYREELGSIDAAPDPGAETPLTTYEVASELSFFLTGSLPDDELWAAVQGGQFTTSQDYEREATRLLATQGAKDSLRAFLHQWMATDQLTTVSKDTSIYPSFNPSLSASMASELDQFFDAVLWSGDGSLRELFSSQQSFADQNLAALYGVATDSPEFHPVTLDARLRPGILTRAGFLAAHADSDSSGPIARGVFLLQSIMCSPPPPRPSGVPPAPAVDDPSVKDLTTRQRFEEHASNPQCAGCHARIDGIGFGFEEFDGLGAYRLAENGQPIDCSGQIMGTGEIDGDFLCAAELAARLAGSRLLATCFARQALRYAMGQVEDPQDDLQWLAAGWSTDAKMTSLLLAIVDHPIFVMRTFE